MLALHAKQFLWTLQSQLLQQLSFRIARTLSPAYVQQGSC